MLSFKKYYSISLCTAMLLLQVLYGQSQTKLRPLTLPPNELNQDLQSLNRFNFGTLLNDAPDCSVSVCSRFFSGKIFLQGAYDPVSGQMSNQLNNLGILQARAARQPFDVAPFNYNGNESVGAEFYAAHPGIVDWILIEIRNATNPANVVSRRAAFVSRDGSIVATDGVSTGIAIVGVAPGKYYVVIRHRNHLAVRSSALVDFSNGSATYDFTTAASNTFQNQTYTSTVQTGSVWAMRAGDANANSNVKFNGPENDQNEILNGRLSGMLSLVINNVYARQDVNMDGTIKWNGPANDQTVLLNVALLGFLGLVYTEQL